MTRSHRTIWIALTALSGLALAIALPAIGAHHEEGESRPEMIRDAIDVVSANVQGKNVYIPSTIVVEAGKPATLSAYNTTDTPHGFSVDGTEISEVLMPGKEQAIEVPALKAGIYNVYCQLHPPHRNGRLVVMEF